MGAHGVTKKAPGTGQRALVESRRVGPGPELSPLHLYELCVQNTRVLAPLLRAIHGGTPRILHEDFCGSAALSRAWVSGSPGGRALATDRDPLPLAHARRAPGGRARALRLRRADVLAAPPAPRPHTPADVIFVGNFSIGEIHARAGLVGYLRACRARLARVPVPGVFVCDTYGGTSAWRTGGVQRLHPVPGDTRTRIRYTWQQRAANPLTGVVENALHFRVERAGVVVAEHTDAFVYRWRLWTLAELRDAMLEAGFRTVQVYGQVPDAADGDGNAYALPITDAADLGDNWIVCVAARP